MTPVALPPADPGEHFQIVEPLCAVFRRRLKAEGLKYTIERAEILDAVLRMPDVFQADALLEALRREGRRASKATVYRTIRLLQDAGILQQVLLDAEHAHYVVAYGRRPTALLIRTDTGAAAAVDAPELVAIRDRLCRERGLVARAHRLIIFADAPGHPPRP